MFHPFYCVINSITFGFFFGFHAHAAELKPSQFSKLVPAIRNELGKICSEDHPPTLEVHHFLSSSTLSQLKVSGAPFTGHRKETK